jgi:hypothetical protein
LTLHLPADRRIRHPGLIRGLVEEAMRAAIDEDPEPVPTPPRIFTDLDRAEVRRALIDRADVRAGPVTAGLRADAERHRQTVTGVEARAAQLDGCELRPEVADTHLLIRFEPTAREDHMLRLDIHEAIGSAIANTVDGTRWRECEVTCRGAVPHLDATLQHCRAQAFDQGRPFADDREHRRQGPIIDVIDELALAARDPGDALRAQPRRRCGRALDQHSEESLVRASMRGADHLGEQALARVRRSGERRAHARRHLDLERRELVDMLERDPEIRTGVPAVTAPVLFRCGLEHERLRAALGRSQRRGKCSVARSDDDDVKARPHTTRIPIAITAVSIDRRKQNATHSCTQV